jgi:hypothetical protein
MVAPFHQVKGLRLMPMTAPRLAVGARPFNAVRQWFLGSMRRMPGNKAGDLAIAAVDEAKRTGVIR